MKSLSSILIATAATFLCVACQTSNNLTADADPVVSTIGATLAPGDSLRISFSGAPELNQEQKIRPDGKISLPKVGEIQAAGRKPSAIQAQLASLYKSTLQNSEVTLVVANSNFPVNVLGAVNRPGEINLDRPSLLQAIGRAGGVTRGLADGTKVRIIHETTSGTKVRIVNLEAMMSGKSKDVIVLQHGDTIFVPEKWL